MKNMLIAGAVAAALSLPLDALAASDEELSDIRTQLQGLLQRVDRLEQENAQLKTENENLKAQDEYLKAETKGLRKDAASAVNEINKTKGADWASRVVAKGDLRYRHEMIDDPTRAGASGTLETEQTRHRIRARLGFDAKITDTLMIGLQVATGADDPRSSNQTLGSSGTRKAIGFDLAYFDWKFASWGNLIGGKMKYPYVRSGQSLFYDNDYNPEGLAVTFNRGMFFGSAYGFWLEERNNVAATTATAVTTCLAPAGTTCSDDIYITGGQIGARFPIGASTLTAAVGYYDLHHGQGQRPFFNAASSSAQNGNSVGPFPGVVGQGLLYDFNVAQAFLDFSTTLGSMPLQIWVDALQNQEAEDLDTAYAAGVLIGKASNYRTWEFGAAYELHEKDSQFGQFIDSDFGDGAMDAEGYIFRAGYAPVRNWTINATYFLNKRNVDVPNSVFGSETDYDRLQVDFNVKF